MKRFSFIEKSKDPIQIKKSAIWQFSAMMLALAFFGVICVLFYTLPYFENANSTFKIIFTILFGLNVVFDAWLGWELRKQVIQRVKELESKNEFQKLNIESANV